MLTRFPLMILSLWLSLPLSGAFADELCFDQDPVFDQTAYWDFGVNSRWDFYLPSKNINGPFRTRAATHMDWNGNLNISFDHVLPPNQVGLQYTIHRFQVEIGQMGSQDYFVFDHDFTQNCTQPGLSFFPGESHKLLPIYIPHLPTPAENKVLPVHVRTWGHL
jgi:hypothetical protein